MKREWILGAALLAATAVFSAAGPAAAGPRHCPPGLAKKGSCVPPGLRKPVARPAPVVVYVPGDRIPPTVAYQRVYHERYDLRRPPAGQFYANIGGKIYLMAEATQRVIEAINLVDAATR